MALRRLLIPVVVITMVGIGSPTRAMGSMESQVFSMINGERSTALIEHSGLLAAARQHSQEMAASGGLNHDGADERVANAAPDPAEANGAPDDGFAVAAWCENVTYSTGFPESQVATKLYQQWRNSAPHQACMTNSSKNVAAVGIYYDGSTWWATFIAEVDHTPPGGPPPAQPARNTTPTATTAPAAKTAGAPAAAPSRPASVGTAPVSAPFASLDGSAPVASATTGGDPSSPPAEASAQTQTQAPVRRFEVSVQPLASLHHAVPTGVDLAELAAIFAFGVFLLFAFSGLRAEKPLRRELGPLAEHPKLLPGDVLGDRPEPGRRVEAAVGAR